MSKSRMRYNAPSKSAPDKAVAQVDDAAIRSNIDIDIATENFNPIKSLAQIDMRYTIVLTNILITHYQIRQVTIGQS